jgi:hypothetical protein
MNMRKNILLFIVIVLMHFKANAQMKIGSYAVRNGVTDTYPTHLDSLGQGGFMSLQNIASRNAILI